MNEIIITKAVLEINGRNVNINKYVGRVTTNILTFKEQCYKEIEELLGAREGNFIIFFEYKELKERIFIN